MFRLRSLFCISALLATVPAFAQGLAWQYVDPVPHSAGARATLFGFPISQPHEQPGFSPNAVVAREDGAYLILPVNGGGGHSQTAEVVNPSWRRLRGFQVLRLDEAGQVLWKRFWNLGADPVNFATSFALELSEARLTPDGGLAMRSGSRVVYLSAEGGARRIDPWYPPATCYLGPSIPDVVRVQLNASGDAMVTFRQRPGEPMQACAIGPDGEVVGSVEAPDEQSMAVLDFQRAVGFLVSTHHPLDPNHPGQGTRLRQGSVDRWLRSETYYSEDRRLWLSPMGDAWLPDGAEVLRVISAEGTQRAEISHPGWMGVQAWLANGDALLVRGDLGDIRRVSGDGTERWRSVRAPTHADLTDWQMLGDNARMLVLSGEVITLNLVTGGLQSSTAFALGGLAAGPLGMTRHITASSGRPETSWPRAICFQPVGFCHPKGVSFANTMDVRVYESATGIALAGPAASGFGFPTYARLGELAPAVAREANTLEVAQARYVSNGEKEVLEVTRLSERGHPLWRRQLEIQRSDVADAQVEVVNGQVYVATSSRGAVWQREYRLWALGAQGQIRWQLELAKPYKQLARVFVGSGYVLCGLGHSRDTAGWWSEPDWHCYDAEGGLLVDTTLSPVPESREFEISRVLGNRVHLRVVEPAEQSGASMRFVVIDGQGVIVDQPTWQIDPPPAPELVRVDAIVRRGINLVSAPVYASDEAFEPKALLVAAFDSAGNRLWQHRFDQGMRPAGFGHIYTAIDTDDSGVVHVAFPPRLGPNQFPLRVCRLAAADGAHLGCSDAPMEGRVGALFATAEPYGVWMWANQTLASGANQLTLYPLSADGIGAPVYQQEGLQLRQPGSVIGRPDRSWAVAEPASYAGVHSDNEAPTTRVLLFQPGSVFGDGFEDSATQ